MGTISTLPVWKKDASAADRLEELACMAREFPERFNQFIIAYQELKPATEGRRARTLMRTTGYSADTSDPLRLPTLNERLGLLEQAKFDLMNS